MPRDVTPEHYQGLLIPDPYAEVWEAESAYTEQGPRAGRPEPAQSSRLMLGSSGEQRAAIDVQTQDPGFPSRGVGVDAVTGLNYPAGATFVWRRPSEDWRGYDPPAMSTDHEEALSAVGSIGTRDPCMIQVRDDTSPLLVAQVDDPAKIGQRFSVEALVRPDGSARGQWARVHIYGDDNATNRFRPCGFQLPSGRIHVYHSIVDSFGGVTLYNVWLWFSDDNGLSWEFGGPVLLRPLEESPDRMRVAYLEGQVCLVVSLTIGGDRRVQSYASSDAGLSFRFVSSVGPTVSPVRYDASLATVTAGPAGFVVALAGYEDSASGLQVYTLGDAYDRINLLTPIVSDSTTLRDVALCTDETGAVHRYIAFDTSTGVLPAVSYDGGLTWTGYAPGTSEIMSLGTTDVVTDLSVSAWRGLALMAHRGDYALPTYEDSIGVCYLGGWATLCMPSRYRLLAETASVRWTTMYMPACGEPSSTSRWARVLVNAPTIILGQGRLTLNRTGGTTDAVYYTMTPASDPDQGIGAEWSIVPGSLDRLTNSDSVLLCVEIAGVQGFEAEIRMGQDGVSLYDSSAGVQLADVAVDTTAGITVRAWINRFGEVLVTVRSDLTTEDRLWSTAQLSGTLTDNAGARGGSTVEFGARVAPGATSESTEWLGRFVTCEGGDTGQGQGTAPLNPEDLRGRLYVGNPYAGERLALHASSGPSWRGERWSVPTDARFALDRAIVESSPRLEHRTEVADPVGSDAPSYAIRWDGGTTEATSGTSGLLGVYMDCDWSTVNVELYQPGTGWVAIGVVDRTEWAASLPADVSGTAVRPSASASGGPFLRFGELVGASVVCEGGTPAARRIVQSGAGRWSSGAFAPTLRIQGADGTEAGPISIVPRASTLLIDLAGTAYSAVRLSPLDWATGPGLPSVEGAHTLRTLVVGWVYPFALPYSWGRSIAVEAGPEVSETADRMVRARALAPTRRVIEIGWIDGIDQTQVESDDADPDFVRPSGGSWATGSPYGVAYALAGLIRELDGSRTPVVYLPHVPRLESGQVRLLHRRRDHVLVRLSDSVRIESRQGEEHIDEVVNIATITATEEV